MILTKIIVLKPIVIIFFYLLFPHCLFTWYGTIFYFQTKMNHYSKTFDLKLFFVYYGVLKLLYLTFLTSRPFSNTLFGLLGSYFHHRIRLLCNYLSHYDYIINFCFSFTWTFILYCPITFPHVFVTCTIMFSLYHYSILECIV